MPAITSPWNKRALAVMVDRWSKADIYAWTPRQKTAHETASLSPRPNHGILLGISCARIMSNNLLGLMTVGPQYINGILPLTGGILTSLLSFLLSLLVLPCCLFLWSHSTNSTMELLSAIVIPKESDSKQDHLQPLRTSQSEYCFWHWGYTQISDRYLIMPPWK